MKSILKLLIISISFIASASAVAEPIVTRNVHVIRNATASQCPSSYNGRGSDEISTTVSGAGQNNNIATPGLLSCTGCAVDNTSGDCVCKTCYSYTN